ncbi:type I polyketide synthase [Streptomyces sp. YU58]|uniref:type I polyketide synthase n=1 Tax=Streptomyces sp. SX92 TaxID=3158972 RepID=UPI0027B979A4|nr:type I polyketide synthase [Streptomyces coralus]WLW50150.1 beta-ketoacyl synthase N-terminal-like domain-containing protein [Streptomyces coralus]
MNAQDREETQEPDGIAVIGMAGRFPMARTVAEFWRNLREGRECLETLDDAELRRQGVPDEVLSDPMYMRRAGTLDGIEEFDAEFFGFPPSLAATMDPQLRLLLECSWHALEDAACDPARVDGAVGVFVSGSACNYYPYHVLSRHDPRKLLGAGSSSAQMSLWSANDVNFYATRIAHAFDLHGPALSVQTACSSALTAVHLACQSLLCGESDVALAGGMSVKVPHRVGYLRDLDSVMSPDGHCRPFDAKAGGTVFTSGGGVVVLKRLGDAVADGDDIRAVIRGSAVNNDGALKMGYTAPSVEMQAAVIREALAVAGVEPREVGYVEAHGTGTALGDPVEVAALRRAFGDDQAEPWCGLGSVKGNVGHCETAAGVVGLIKTVLCLQHRTLVPTLHFTDPNPELELAGSAFRIQDRLTEWSGERPRLAGVTSLGAGGTNVHVVLEEAPEHETPAARPGPQVLVLSARTERALAESGERLAAHLGEHPGTDLADLALTLAAGRQAFRYRRSVVVRDWEQAAAALADAGAPVSDSGVPGEDPVVLMLFSGSADEPAPTGLYESDPAFAEHFDRCAELFGEHFGTGFADALRKDDDPSARPETSEARSFCVQYALARALEAWGVTPAAVGGGGVGTYVAAHLAQVMSLDDAVRLAARRDPESCTPTAPQLPLLCAASGRWLTESEALDPAGWAGRGDEPVHWEKAVAAAQAEGHYLIVSAGPEPLPSSAVAVRRGSRDPQAFRAALGELWARGVPVDWAPMASGHHRIPLPGYPFQRSRHWLDSAYVDAPRDVVAAEAEAPAGSTEQVLSRLWSEVLGIDSLSPDDDFFLLGGDSVMAAQVAGRARSSGLRFNPRMMFRHPTLQQLADAVGPLPGESVPQAPTAGPTAAAAATDGGQLPMVPAQLELTADPAVLPDLDVPLVFRVGGDVSAQMLEEALVRAVSHHDALCVELVERSGMWEQRRSVPAGPLLTAAAEEDGGESDAATLVATATAAARRHREPGRRAAVEAVLVEGDGVRHVVLLVHASVSDLTAQRLLGEDVTTACRQLLGGRPVQLPPVGTSWQTWSDCLTTWALDDAVLLERPYWLDLVGRAGAAPGLAGTPAGRRVLGSVRLLHDELDPALTTALRTVQRRHRMRPGTLVLAAVSAALGRHGDGPGTLIDIMDSARDAQFPGIDLSRTVGRCSSAYPLVLDAGPGDPERLLGATREALDGIPYRGVHYGVLRHLHPQTAEALRRLPAADVTFTDAGTRTAATDTRRTPLQAVTPSGLSTGEPALCRGHALDVRTYRQSGRVHVEWWYDSARCTEDTVRELREHALATLVSCASS